jgi:hypothetical protein
MTATEILEPSDSMAKLALLTCLASTLFMTGVIWFVQVVHYPLFDRVELEAFRRYHSEHTRATAFVVVLPMILELLTSGFLVGQRPEGTKPWMAWLGLSCALASWGLTIVYSVPAHGQLAKGFDVEAHRSLVWTNGLRVASWSAHSLILLVMTARALR